MGRRRSAGRRLAGERRARARRRPGRDRRALPRGQGASGRLLHDRLRLAGPRARGRGDVARRALDGNRGAAGDDPRRRGDVSIEEQLRGLAPRVLGTLVRRYGRFDACEDAVQEALLDAALQWPRDGVPANPRGWLLTAAHRRLIDELRSASARHRREEGLAREPPPGEAADEDDTLELLFMCCHESLTPASQVALTLRAVGGLTTAEIASAFLVPESTMAQRISRAKATIRAAGARFAPPAPAALPVGLHVLYLIVYEVLERVSPGPVVTLNRAVAVAMVHGPRAGLELLETLEEPLRGHHRLAAVRAHLLEMAGDEVGARAAYERAARLTTSIPERRYLEARMAALQRFGSEDNTKCSTDPRAGREGTTTMSDAHPQPAGPAPPRARL